MVWPVAAAAAAMLAGVIAQSAGRGRERSQLASRENASVPAVVHSAGATGAGASGYSSVFTADSANGHLQESYLPYIGDGWSTQDLSAKYGTPSE